MARKPARAPARPEITVAICTHRRYDLLGEAVELLLGQSLPPDRYRIIVVDNAPDPEAGKQAARRWRGVANLTWIEEPVAGLSRARNASLAATDTPLLAFLDDDAVACPTWLASKIAAFGQFGPTVHAVGGRVRPRFGAPRPAWLNDNMLAYLSVLDLGEQTRLLRPGEWVVGANISYRTEQLRQAGGFSTALGRVGSGAALMSNEETELADRIGAAGGLVGYAPDAEVEHFVPADRLSQDWFRRRIAWQAVSDFVRSPEVMRAAAPDAWQRVKTFLAACPPADRTLRALALPQAESRIFGHQMSAVYETIVALLSGVPEPDDY